MGKELILSKMGYARYEFLPLEEGEAVKVPKDFPVPEDVNAGRGEIFNITYEWEQNNCKIKKIEWYPKLPDKDAAENSTTVEPPENFVGDEFKQDNKITIQIGTGENSIIVSPDDDKGYHLNRNKSDDTYPKNSIENDEGTSSLLTVSVGSAYLTASFNYSNVVVIETEDYKVKVNYFIKINNIKIPKISKYENNIVFTKDGIMELVNNIKAYPIVDIATIGEKEKDKDDDEQTIWQNYTDGSPCIKIVYGNSKKESKYSENKKTIGYKYVKVGSNIKFKDAEGNDIEPSNESNSPTGTIAVSIDGNVYYVPVNGLGGTGNSDSIKLKGHLLPTTDNKYDIGGDQDADDKLRWRNLYLSGSLGDSANPIPNAYITNLYLPSSDGSSSFDLKGGTTAQFLRGEGSGKNPSWSNILEGPLTTAGLTSSGVVNITNTTAATSTTTGALKVSGGIGCAGYIYGSKVYNAVFNDYAECRTTISLAPGHVVIDQDDGSLACSSARLQPGAQVISDTYGHLMGETSEAKTPIAVAGRVLVYPYQPRENYHAGMAVCSAPAGTVDIMTRDEIRNFPDCIIGIVSEIPQYDTWGTDNVKVDGRIWIKVK